jgi:hypothetical protein
MTVLEQITGILQFYELESNIPLNHHYWDLLNLHRAGVTDAPERVYEPPQAEGKAPPSGTPGQIQARLSQLRNTNRTILNSFGRREPNIPFTNEYWFNQNVIKSLERELAELAG